MGLFEALLGIAAMPVRAALDVVRLPGKILNGEGNLIENISNGLDKIEDELNEE